MTGEVKGKPTDAELAVLRVLWDRGPSTVRQVHEALARGEAAAGGRSVRYTTTLKTMQIMADKGLLTRDEAARSHVYAAAVEEGVTQRRLVDELMERAFGGSAGRLVAAALASGDISSQEMKEIRKLLRRHEEPSGKSDTRKGAAHERPE